MMSGVAPHTTCQRVNWCHSGELHDLVAKVFDEQSRDSNQGFAEASSFTLPSKNINEGTPDIRNLRLLGLT